MSFLAASFLVSFLFGFSCTEFSQRRTHRSLSGVATSADDGFSAPSKHEKLPELLRSQRLMKQHSRSADVTVTDLSDE